MDYVFDLQEKGKRILYAQGGRIIGLMPQGRLIRQAAVLQEDFLADLTAALHGGRVYYAYHSLEHRVVLHTLEADVPLPLLSDVSGSSTNDAESGTSSSIAYMSSCRRSGLIPNLS